MTKFVCKYPWTHFEVNNPNGDVTMCCDNSTVLGNVNEESVLDIWNGERYRDMRRKMLDQGAHVMCPNDCPVLHGCKEYQELDWHKDLPEGSVAKENAERNEREFANGAVDLESKPRWMRFAYSYKCNLDCYHCYQREDALVNDKLPDRYMDEVHELAPYYQVLFFFGGEPFLYKPVIAMMETIDVDPGCRFFLITNGTLLTDRMFENLEKRNIGLFAVSLDSATDTSFSALRDPKGVASFDGVIENVKRLAELKEKKRFFFEISMTVNAENCGEIEDFVDLGLAQGAEPLLLLVSNPFGEAGFQQQYLHFSDDQFDLMEGQIDRSLEKVRARGFSESEASLLRLKSMIAAHKKANNKIAVFRARKIARPVFRLLPLSVQSKIRQLFQ